MYFSSLKLFEVLKFFQFLMLFENQFLDTSSNFGAPQILAIYHTYAVKNASYKTFHTSFIFQIFSSFWIKDMNYTIVEIGRASCRERV